MSDECLGSRLAVRKICNPNSELFVHDDGFAFGNQASVRVYFKRLPDEFIEFDDAAGRQPQDIGKGDASASELDGYLELDFGQKLEAGVGAVAAD